MSDPDKQADMLECLSRTPSPQADVESRARAMLAAEYEREDQRITDPLDPYAGFLARRDKAALRAIAAALAPPPQARVE